MDTNRKGQTLKQEAFYHSAIGAPGLYELTMARKIGNSSILAPKFAQAPPVSTNTLTQKMQRNTTLQKDNNTLRETGDTPGRRTRTKVSTTAITHLTQRLRLIFHHYLHRDLHRSLSRTPGRVYPKTSIALNKDDT
ncbi:hypothetical protein PROFUN_14211 [Planoprotostelium fungivorum]|uniref:Uncharacterized protein n=1 Tax=Planoprotostelium fungivorum TaxID=1890364 RepID=A0A2P6N0L2_9EUKA|nr:hypothetical protein PROFUN_14211 [Planoprotostelium fungivorum]